MATTDAPPAQGQKSGSIFLRKTGPLANWVWMALLLLVALAYAMWKRNRAAAVAPADDSLGEPANQTPPPVFIVPQAPTPPVTVNPVITVPAAPPGGGRPEPPGGVVGRPVPAPPKPVPKPSAPGRWVTVTRWPDRTKPKESTLWDIAAEYLGAGAKWTTIWSDPQNAQLKALRKDPKKIQPGDRFFVRGAK